MAKSAVLESTAQEVAMENGFFSGPTETESDEQDTTRQNVDTPENSEEWEVEDIVAHKINPTTHEKEYLVKWKGEEWDTLQWVPISEMLGEVLIRQYERMRLSVSLHEKSTYDTYSS